MIVLGAGPRRAGTHRGARRARRRGARAARAGDRAPRRAARAGRAGRARRRSRGSRTTSDGRESPIRPERFARLVTLAGILIDAAREGRKLDVGELCETLQVTEQELRQDIDVLNVVNFGGGSYVLYAEVQGDQIEVDPEPYGDNFARPARLLPLEAKALVAAIDLIGEHLPGGLARLRAPEDRRRARPGPGEEGLQITTAKGDDSEVARVVSSAITAQRLLRSTTTRRTRTSSPSARSSPTSSPTGRRAGTSTRTTSRRTTPRSFRLDRIRDATVLDERFEPRPGIEPDVHGWLATGEVADRRAPRASGSRPSGRAGRARTSAWSRSSRTGRWWSSALTRRTSGSRARSSRRRGDAVVLEPDEARQAVLDAAEALGGRRQALRERALNTR